MADNKKCQCLTSWLVKELEWGNQLQYCLSSQSLVILPCICPRFDDIAIIYFSFEHELFPFIIKENYDSI